MGKAVKDSFPLTELVDCGTVIFLIKEVLILKNCMIINAFSPGTIILLQKKEILFMLELLMN